MFIFIIEVFNRWINLNSIDSYRRSPFSSSKYSTYFDVYDNLFKDYVNKPITFLEIGVANGGSLFMWREYFGTQARIIGVDLNPEVAIWRDYGFEIYIGSQSDSRFWETLLKEVGSIDIVLDDGGHTFLQQITTVNSLLDAMVPSGLIVIEDTHTSYMNEFAPKPGSTFIDFAFSIVHGINYRYGGFSTNYEKQIYSVHFYESIVAFRINSEKCLPSTSLLNNRNVLSYNARDYRYGDKDVLDISKHRSFYLKLKKNELIYNLFKNLYNFISLIFRRLKNSKERKHIKNQIRFIHKKFKS